MIEKMLLADFDNVIATEAERDIDLVRMTETDVDTVDKDVEYDECMMSAIVSGLLRQQNYKFLEQFEAQSISSLKVLTKQTAV